MLWGANVSLRPNERGPTSNFLYDLSTQIWHRLEAGKQLRGLLFIFLKNNIFMLFVIIIAALGCFCCVPVENCHTGR